MKKNAILINDSIDTDFEAASENNKYFCYSIKLSIDKYILNG